MQFINFDEYFDNSCESNTKMIQRYKHVFTKREKRLNADNYKKEVKCAFFDDYKVCAKVDSILR